MSFLLGKIPRFSPSFSFREATTAARYLARSGPEGEVVHTFEREFAAFIGAQHAVMVPSARYGFWLLLEGWGIDKDDEVIIPALTYFAIPSMAKLRRCKPVFADVGRTTHVLDPAAFEAAITERTKAVVPTHLFGTPCDMDAIRSIAQKHGVKVIEDCAQSTGARYKGARVGSLGDAAYYTFGLTKNITTLSGAMITTDDAELAQAIRTKVEAGQFVDKSGPAKEAVVGLAMYLATHPSIYPFTTHQAIVLGNLLGKDPIHERFGEPERQYVELPSYYEDSRPRAAQAAVGRVQLERIEELNGNRARNGRYLDENLANVPGLTVPSYPAGAEPIYMSFVVHHADRQGLMRELRARGVDTTVGYMSNNADAHGIFGLDYAKVPHAEEAARDLLHIPVHPNLTQADLDHICEAVRQACLALE